MTLNVDATRDDQTEDDVKAIYAKTGGVVRGATAPLAPEQRGLHGFLEGIDEVSGVGDWAFATNVASVNMGMGFSDPRSHPGGAQGSLARDRERHRGPRPRRGGARRQVAGVARALIAKLPV